MGLLTAYLYPRAKYEHRTVLLVSQYAPLHASIQIGLRQLIQVCATSRQKVRTYRTRGGGPGCLGFNFPSTEERGTRN